MDLLNANNNECFTFTRATKAKFTDLTENEVKSVKVSFGLKIEFSIERNCKTQYMEHYFRENEALIFNRHDED